MISLFDIQLHFISGHRKYFFAIFLLRNEKSNEKPSRAEPSQQARRKRNIMAIE